MVCKSSWHFWQIIESMSEANILAPGANNTPAGCKLCHIQAYFLVLLHEDGDGWWTCNSHIIAFDRHTHRAVTDRCLCQSSTKTLLRRYAVTGLAARYPSPDDGELQHPRTAALAALGAPRSCCVPTASTCVSAALNGLYRPWFEVNVLISGNNVLISGK